MDVSLLTFSSSFLDQYESFVLHHHKTDCMHTHKNILSDRIGTFLMVPYVSQMHYIVLRLWTIHWIYQISSIHGTLFTCNFLNIISYSSVEFWICTLTNNVLHWSIRSLSIDMILSISGHLFTCNIILTFIECFTESQLWQLGRALCSKKIRPHLIYPSMQMTWLNSRN